MKKYVNLPYKSEDHFMLVYDYSVHNWMYDSKFWLSKDKKHWCYVLHGEEVIVGDVNENTKNIMHKYETIIQERESINQSYLNHLQCRKRSCICKKCDMYCNCLACNDKAIKYCDKKDRWGG